MFHTYQIGEGGFNNHHHHWEIDYVIALNTTWAWNATRNNCAMILVSSKLSLVVR